MQKILYYTIYPLIWLLSKMPFLVLYLISDIVFFIVFYIIGYRKMVVLNNLRITFPNKSEKELYRIRRKFFRHFVDVLMEMLKTFTISKKEISKHYKFKNIALLEDLEKKGKSMVMIGSHYANFEWTVSLNLHTDIKSYATYTKVSNKMLEKKIKVSRERFGGVLVLKNDTIKNMDNNHKKNQIGIYGLLSDQSPQIRKTFYWANFLGERVPIHTGAEMLAKKYNYAVVYMQIEKIRRGFYEVEFELLTENPNEYKNYEITDIFLKKAEKQIRNKPQYYFWTHNRFKHAGKEDIVAKRK